MDFDRERYLSSHLGPDEVHVVLEDGNLVFYPTDYLRGLTHLSEVLILESFPRLRFEKLGEKLDIRAGKKNPAEDIEKKARRLEESEYRSALDKIIRRMRRIGENTDLRSAIFKRNPNLVNIWIHPYDYDFFHYLNDPYLLATGWREPIILLYTEKDGFSDNDLREKWPKAYADRKMIIPTGLVAYSKERKRHWAPPLLSPLDAVNVSENVLKMTYRFATFRDKMEINLLMLELRNARDYILKVEEVEEYGIAGI